MAGAATSGQPGRGADRRGAGVEEGVEDHVLVVDGRRVVVQLVEVLGGSGSLVWVCWGREWWGGW
jgi:hypothetical protein